MRKILFVSDAGNFSNAAFEFVKHMNNSEPVLVTGVFVSQFDYANLWGYASTAAGGVPYVPTVPEEDIKLIKKNIAGFEQLCQKNDLKYRVHDYSDEGTFSEILKESRFTDLIILSGEMFFQGLSESLQHAYLKQVIHSSECPVIVVPENYRNPEKNILAYDGSDDAVHAIKQFAYLFPELTKNPTLLVFATLKEGTDVPAQDLISEFASQHFPDLTFYHLDVQPKKFFNTWLSEQGNCLLVSGAFSRTSLSQLIKRSFVTEVIEEHKLPVFVAHR
jgi:hypothetical protein